MTKPYEPEGDAGMDGVQERFRGTAAISFCVKCGGEIGSSSILTSNNRMYHPECSPYQPSYDTTRAADVKRLLDAAPDLLAALIETLAIATRNEEGDFADRARAAISRARGLTP